MYDNLKNLGSNILKILIAIPLRQEANNDILKFIFAKIKVNSFAKSVKFKYPRQRKTISDTQSGQGFKEVNEINTNLRYVIEELDQICQQDQVEVGFET